METKEEREARLAMEEMNTWPTWNKTKMEYNMWTEHKHMSKLIKLEDRIAHWKAIGPACTEDEWDQMLNDLDQVTATRRACSMDPKYAISKTLLKRFNQMWNKYKTKIK